MRSGMRCPEKTFPAPFVDIHGRFADSDISNRRIKRQSHIRNKAMERVSKDDDIGIVKFDLIEQYVLPVFITVPEVGLIRRRKCGHLAHIHESSSQESTRDFRSFRNPWEFRVGRKSLLQGIGCIRDIPQRGSPVDRLRQILPLTKITEHRPTASARDALFVPIVIRFFENPHEAGCGCQISLRIHHSIIHWANPIGIKSKLYRTSLDAGIKGGLTGKKRGWHGQTQLWGLFHRGWDGVCLRIGPNPAKLNFLSFASHAIA